MYSFTVSGISVVSFVNTNVVSSYFAVGKFDLSIQSMELLGPRRVIKKNHLVRENGVSLLSNIDDLDPWTAWAYKPRTISLLLVGACFLM